MCGWRAYAPAGQGRQASLLVARSSELYVPGAHAVHVTAPGLELYEPDRMQAPQETRGVRVGGGETGSVDGW